MHKHICTALGMQRPAFLAGLLKGLGAYHDTLKEHDGAGFTAAYGKIRTIGKRCDLSLRHFDWLHWNKISFVQKDAQLRTRILEAANGEVDKHACAKLPNIVDTFFSFLSFFRVYFSAAPTHSSVSGADQAMTVALAPQNVAKNRYKNVLSYDHSRVVLKDGQEGDYINAVRLCLRALVSFLLLFFLFPPPLPLLYLFLAPNIGDPKKEE